MPRAQLEAVVAMPIWPGAFAKVIVVGRSARCDIIVVAGRWPGARLVAAPGWVVAIAELLGCAGFVGVVAKSEYRALDLVEQPCGHLRAIRAAGGNVAGSDEDRVGGGRGRGRGAWRGRYCRAWGYSRRGTWRGCGRGRWCHRRAWRRAWACAGRGFGGGGRSRSAGRAGERLPAAGCSDRQRERGQGGEQPARLDRYAVHRGSLRSNCARDTLTYCWAH